MTTLVLLAGKLALGLGAFIGMSSLVEVYHKGVKFNDKSGAKPQQPNR